MNGMMQMISMCRARVGLPGRCGWTAMLCLALLGAGWGQDSQASNAKPGGFAAGENAVRSLIAQYAKSVDNADTVLAARIWSHSPEVSFIHPLGEEHGYEQIAQDVYVHLMGDTFSERDLQIHDITVHVHGKAAWAEFRWDFHARFKKDGSLITTHGRETQIYSKEKDGWKLVHVHYSPAPAAPPGQGL